MSLFNRVAFYPTLFYNVMMSKVGGRPWYSRVDETVLLGALPFRGMTKHLTEEENVRGVITLNEDWELHQFVNTEEEWKQYDVKQLKIPTLDFTGTPTQEDIWKAVGFIIKHKLRKESVYVHCKAGRTRSATVVACYLVKVHGWSPKEAIDFIKEKRSHIWLRDKQIESVQKFYETCKAASSAYKSGG